MVDVVASRGMEEWEHGAMMILPLSQIVPNPWNPNEMSDAAFNLLTGNVDEVGFLDPLTVVPVYDEETENPRLADNGGQLFRIIDGEQRYHACRMTEAKEVPVVVVSPVRVSELEQMRQTARMNNIRGSWNKKKFQDFVRRSMEQGMPVDDLAYELGFEEQKELDILLEKARKQLPDPDMKKEFDKVKEEIKTVDDLSNVLNRLFTKFGSTVPYHFMVLDFGGKEHIWVKMSKDDKKKVERVAKSAMAMGYTFDSFILALLKKIPFTVFAEKYREEMVIADPDE